MRGATPVKLQVPAHRPSAYESGVADGDACRRRGGKPSVFLRVTFDDDCSSGFMAGFYQRARKNRES